MEKKEKLHRNASNQEGIIKIIFMRNVGHISIFDILNQRSINAEIFRTPNKTSKLQGKPHREGERSLEILMKIIMMKGKEPS